MFPPPKLALASTIRQRALLGGAAFVAVVFFTISLQRYHLLLWTGIILLPSHLPPPPPVHDRAGFNHGYNESVKGVFNGTWDWRRDSRTLTLDSEQCDAAFPGLFLEVDRAVQHRAQRKITLADLDAVSKKETGYFRVMIYDQELYIIEANVEDNTRGLATLHALQRALLTAPGLLPDIEMVLRVNDFVAASTAWSYTRKEDDGDVFLMPDFGYYAWPEPKVGSYGELRRNIDFAERATPWEHKDARLVWRGAPLVPVRHALVAHTRGRTWADVKALDWHNHAALERDRLAMEDHCRYKFVAHTEGNSYSGRLKYLQNCRSVVVAHKLEWIQHHHHLLVASGPHQNFVEVERDWSDLEAAMRHLLRDDAEARRIADNSVRMFRERYLTSAAEACYWRKLIVGWAAASDFEVHPRGVPVESFFLLRTVDWEAH